MTPTVLLQIMNASHPDSQEYFHTNKGSVLLRMFQTMWKRVSQMRHQNIKVVQIFQILASEGFIPLCRSSHERSNQRFGYINHEGTWEEWPVVSVQIMRLYWLNLFKSISTKQLIPLYTICQTLIHMLPHEKRRCSRCQWNLSVNSFHNEKLCIFCQDILAHPSMSLSPRGDILYRPLSPDKSRGCQDKDGLVHKMSILSLC